jgi:hypothetical protein
VSRQYSMDAGEEECIEDFGGEVRRKEMMKKT